jgi:Family of unknown function (DUF6152)
MLLQCCAASRTGVNSRVNRVWTIGGDVTGPSLHRLAASALLLLFGASLSAHHSFAVFDRDTQVTLDVVVKEFQWTNPHVFIQVMVRNESGKDEEWSIEGASPNSLVRRGWARDTFKAGDRLTLVVNPLRDGSRGGFFLQAKWPDGRTLGELNMRPPG